MVKILVVEHEANAGIGLVGERILASGSEMVTVGPLTGHPIPATAAGFDGVVVLGGTPGPTDDAEAAWLPRVRELIGNCLDIGKPYLGICLGAQLLAVVAGGIVGDVRRGPEVGLNSLSITPDGQKDPLLGDLPTRLQAMQWHFLEIQELPLGVVSLCESDRCPNQGFRVGPMAWGLQFHLEALTGTAEAWAGSGGTDLEAVGVTAEQVVDAMRSNEAELRQVWSLVSDRWMAIVEDYSTE